MVTEGMEDTQDTGTVLITCGRGYMWPRRSSVRLPGTISRPAGAGMVVAGMVAGAGADGKWYKIMRAGPFGPALIILYGVLLTH